MLIWKVWGITALLGNSNHTTDITTVATVHKEIEKTSCSICNDKHCRQFKPWYWLPRGAWGADL